jgi:hypothetical protein
MSCRTLRNPQDALSCQRTPLTRDVNSDVLFPPGPGPPSMCSPSFRAGSVSAAKAASLSLCFTTDLR